MRALKYQAALAALVALFAPLAGCYTLQPANGAAATIGSRVVLEVNDAGRVALGPHVGPEVRTIQGRLVSTQEGEYVVAVDAVRFFTTSDQTWTGEQVRLRTEHIRTTYERRFSRGRTIAFAAASAGVITAFLVTRSLVIKSNPSPDPNIPPIGEELIPRRYP